MPYYSKDKDIQKLVEDIVAAGWATVETKSKHKILVPIDKTKLRKAIPGTPSDRMSFEAFKSQTKRIFGDLPNLDPSLRNKAAPKEKKPVAAILTPKVSMSIDVTQEAIRHILVSGVSPFRVHYYLLDNELERNKERFSDVTSDVSSKLFSDAEFMVRMRKVDGWWRIVDIIRQVEGLLPTALAAQVKTVEPAKLVQVETIKPPPPPPPAPPVIKLASLDEEEARLLAQLEAVRKKREQAAELEAKRAEWQAELTKVEAELVDLRAKVTAAEEQASKLRIHLGLAKVDVTKVLRAETAEPATSGRRKYRKLSSSIPEFEKALADAVVFEKNGKVSIAATAEKHNLAYGSFREWMRNNHPDKFNTR